MNNHIKVSALCVTLCRRQLHDAYDDFKRQTHRNKEMILVAQQEFIDAQTDFLRYVDIGKDPQVSVVVGPVEATLGELRNLSIKHATGDYMIQWDDDDRYHSQRIARQLALHMEQPEPIKSASCIDNFLLLKDNLLYWIDRRKSGMAGSMLWGRQCEFQYPDMKSGEDQEVLNHLTREGKLTVTRPGLVYLRKFHGSNTWDNEHFEKLINNGQMPEAYTWSMLDEIILSSAAMGLWGASVMFGEKTLA